YGPLEAKYTTDHGVWGPNLEAALKDPGVQKFVRRVAPRAALRKGGKGFEGLVLPAERYPSFTEIQDVYRGVRDEASAAAKAGRPNRFAKAKEAADKLRSAMEEDIPGFSEAQAKAYIHYRKVAAFDMGNANKHPREILMELRSLPREARDAYRHGLLDYYESKLLDTQGKTMSNKLMETQQVPLMRRRLRIIADGDPDFKKMLHEFDVAEPAKKRTWRAVASNSTTAEQQTGLRKLMKDFRVRVLVGHVAAALPGVNQEKVAEMLGNALLRGGPEAMTLLAQRMTEMPSIVGGLAAAGAQPPARRSLFQGALR
ncbi:MAG TPA: hypothetical protein VJ997_07830, partial [Longimicrobiales bacterium]|nr:hypothetical protein [Longimicrobiales bacterium]